MADNRIIKTSEQFLYSGVGPLDSKQAPVQSASELNTLTAYEGQRIYVINDGCDYVFKKNLGTYQWCKEDIMALSASVISTNISLGKLKTTVDEHFSNYINYTVNTNKTISAITTGLTYVKNNYLQNLNIKGVETSNPNLGYSKTEKSGSTVNANLYVGTVENSQEKISLPTWMIYQNKNDSSDVLNMVLGYTDNNWVIYDINSERFIKDNIEKNFLPSEEKKGSLVVKGLFYYESGTTRPSSRSACPYFLIPEIFPTIMINKDGYYNESAEYKLISSGGSVTTAVASWLATTSDVRKNLIGLNKRIYKSKNIIEEKLSTIEKKVEDISTGGTSGGAAPSVINGGTF